jgi:hypothetical protein
MQLQTFLVLTAMLVSVGNAIYISLWLLRGWHYGIASDTSYSACLRPGSPSPRSDALTFAAYRGHDFPEFLPLPGDAQLSSVLLTVEESVHYPPIGLPADERWYSLTTAGEGHVHLGPENRLFAVTMFHELHCLRIINLAFSKSPVASVGHIKHCLSYLRQNALCAADLSLEPGDFEKKDFNIEQLGATHVCKDWSTVYKVMDDNFYAWSNNTYDLNAR